jgi:hypothetical protein
MRTPHAQQRCSVGGQTAAHGAQQKRRGAQHARLLRGTGVADRRTQGKVLSRVRVHGGVAARTTKQCGGATRTLASSAHTTQRVPKVV